MERVQSKVFDRGDTLLGVCEALGQDFGFNPLWLRIAFAAPLIWNPVAVFGVYLALGAVVLVSRLLFPSKRAAAAAASPEPAEVIILEHRSDEELPALAAAA